MKFDIDNVILTTKEYESKKDICADIAEHAYNLGLITNKKKIAKGLLEREMLSSTGFEEGFAIPHVQSKYVKTPALIYYRTNDCDYDSLDGLPTSIFFVILVPKDSGSLHLDKLSTLARNLVDIDFKNTMKSTDKEEIFKTLSKIIN